MFKKLFLSLIALASMTLGLHAQSPVHTPTLEGTYTWTGQDTWTFGNLKFLGSIPQCPSGQGVTGLTNDFHPNCSPIAAAGPVWVATLASAQGISDVTINFTAIPSGLTAPGMFYIDGEYETFTGISGNTLTGVVRGVSLTTPANHGFGNAYSIAVPFQPNTQVPRGGVFGNSVPGEMLLGVNCGTPSPLNFSGAISVVQANCADSTKTYNLLDTGQIVQNTQRPNIFAPFYMFPDLGRNLAGNLPIEVTNSNNLVQTNGQYQFQQPVGFGAPIEGPVRAVPVPNIPAVSLSGEQNGGANCSFTYVLSGVDADGNLVPGTSATINNLIPFIFNTQGLVQIQGPQVAGIVTYNLYRTAISGSCGLVTTTGKIGTATTLYPFFSDTGITADGTFPPSANGSVAKQCVGTAANPELYCKLAGASATPPITCSTSVYGWEYVNTSATSSGVLHCYSGSTTWVADTGTTGLQSINSDTTANQQIVGSGSASVSTSGGVTTVTVSGAVGAGGVTQGNYGEIGGFNSSTGGSTTIGPAPGFYALNSSWTLTQMNALFSRFNTVTFTAYSITSNVITLTGNNSYSTGESFQLSGFPTSTFLNSVFLTITSATGSSVVAAFTHANASATETGFGSMNVSGFLSSPGLVMIPPGLAETPATAWTNSFAQTLDWRKGYAWQQASQYGFKCDAAPLHISLTSGSATVNVGSSFGAEAVGRTVVVAQQTGFTSGALQWDWEPTITSYSFPNATLSGTAPQNFTGTVTIGTNNTGALRRAVNDLGGIFPLNLPTGCMALTNTVRWKGTNFIGQQMNSGGFIGFPFRDLLQQQDSLGITAWAIDGANTATFTVNPLNVGTVLIGDTYTLGSFPISSFFNGQNVTVLTIPTPTTFTASFTHATGSATEFGIASPTSAANTNGMRVEHLTLTVNNGGDPRLPYTHYDPVTSAGTTVPPMYRPAQEFGQPMSDPRAPGWGTGQFNGVAQIAQNSAVICVPTQPITFGGNTNTPRLPGIGMNILFAYQGSGMYVGTVASNAGSCSQGNYTPFTLNHALPSTAAFTSASAEWWVFTAPQTLAVAIPGTITLPRAITLATPFPPVPGFEANVSSHGHLITSDGDEWDYTGQTFGGTAGGTPTLTLRKGPTSVNGGTGSSVGAVVFPLNPCAAMFHNPWPVVPSPYAVTITAWSVTSNVATFTANNNYIAGMVVGSLLFSNGSLGFNGITGAVVSATATQFTMNITHANGSGSDQGSVQMAAPFDATYYAGRCAGNAAMSLPGWNGLNTTFSGSGWSLAHFDDITFNVTSINANGVQNNNGSAGIYQQANNTGYGNTMDNLRGTGLDFGFVQGPASVNQHGVRAIGPTSTGQSIRNCTWRTGFPITAYNFQQSNIDRCDTYTTETSEYDNTAVGAATSLYLGFSLSEIDGGGVTQTSQLTIKDFNAEPENGNHEEFPVSVESDAGVVNWIGTIFEGGYNIFGGQQQILHGTQMANPTFNYGTNNYFEHLYGLNTTINDTNVYTGSGFYNWGLFSTCQGTGGQGVLHVCAPGMVQSFDGHDVWASMMGDNVHPSENVLGGMWVPGEWNGMTNPWVFDPTELWWGSHVECSLNTLNQCIANGSDSFGSFIFIGPHQRLADSKYVLKANVKSKSGSPMTFRLLFSTQNGASSSTCTPNFSLTNATFTAQGTWTPVQMAVDLSSGRGCNLQAQFDSSTTTDTLEVGYFNLIPATQQFYLPLGTPTVGAACPVAGEVQVDITHLWVCRPTSGHAFGTGTWDWYGTAN